MKRSSAIITGAILLVVTSLLYLFLGESFFELVMFWIGFAVVLVLEFLAALLLTLSKGDPRKVASAVGAFLGAIGSVLVTVPFINFMPELLGWFGTMMALICGVVVLEVVVLWGHTAIVEEKEAQLESSRAYFESCRNVVTALINSPEGRPYADALRGIEDDLRYADDTKFTNLDGEIQTMLNTLSGGLQTPGYDPAVILADLKDLIRQRQRLLNH